MGGSCLTTVTTITVKIPNYTRGLLLLVFLMGCAARACKGSGKFGLTIHHRFSDPVRKILDAGQNLPGKGTAGYFAALVRRDFAVHGRRLSADRTPLTFSSGNTTYRLSLFGYLHYANVTVGTPGLSFLVALDTGSDLFWLPCDCVSCIRGIRLGLQEMDFSIYSLKTSSTGRKLPCDSPLCGHHTSCSTSSTACPYKVMYLSANTVSSGYLVEDVVHLTANDNPSKLVNAEITFGCGRNQTGSFLDGGAPNGLLGLGLGSVSVPSMLAIEDIAVNSFSMCFGDDGTGRIVFGDQGSSDQGETPFHLRQLNPHYNISITQITVGTNVSHVDAVYAIFDTGTSFTYLNDPAYTLIAKKFDSQVNDGRLATDSNIPFDYCYESSSSQSSTPTPSLNLTMQGGDQFHVTDPTFPLPTKSGYVYCLGMVKSEDVNIIGQNFMTGYRVVFDRERMVLGWKASDCNEASGSSMFPVSPRNSTQHPPKSSEEPQATSKNGSSTSGASLTLRRDLFRLKSSTYMLILIFLEVLLIL